MKPIRPDEAKLICGNVDDLKTYLKGCTDRDLIARCIEHCRRGREMKTKLQMLERHLRKLPAGSTS